MDSSVLVVYFSYSNGNTRRIAERVQAALGADIAEIVPAVPYGASYQQVVEQGRREVEEGCRPAIRPLALDVGKYATIAVGTPTWWYTMAPVMRTFLSAHDWHGKTVIPFMTDAGWPGHVIKDIEAACPGACFRPGMEVRFDSDGGSRMVTTEKQLDEWLAGLRRKED